MTWRITSQQIGIALVLLSSVIFAFVPNTAKLALDDGTSLFFLIACRYAIGAVILAPVMVLTQKSFTIPNHVIRSLMIVSVAALVMLMTSYYAVILIDIGLVMLILYNFPIGVALIGHLNGRERISAPRWLCMGAVLAGLSALIYDGQGDINQTGVIFSLMGLMAFIVFIEYSSRVTLVIGSMTMNFFISVIGMMVMVVLYILPFGFGITLPETPNGVTAIISNGITYIVSWVVLFEGSRLIGATRASLMACIEPLFAAILAIIFFSQTLTLVEWVGFFVVLAAIATFEKLSMQQTS